MIASGERLFALANEPKRFKRFAEAGHNDLDQHGALHAIRQFLLPAPVEAGAPGDAPLR